MTLRCRSMQKINIGLKESLCRLFAYPCIEVSQNSLCCDSFELDVAYRDSLGNSLGGEFLSSPCLISKVCLCRATGNYYRSLGRLALDISGHRQGFNLLLWRRGRSDEQGLIFLVPTTVSGRHLLALACSFCVFLHLQILEPLNSVNRFRYCKIILQSVHTTKLY